MLLISPYQLTNNNYQTNFKAANTKIENRKFSNNDLVKTTAIVSCSLAALGVAGFAALFMKNKNAVMTFEQALKKQGIKIINDTAVLSESGKTFSGEVKRNINWNRKETVKFKDGVVAEKIYHNAFGKELDGEFYKNGKIALKVTKHSGLFLKSFGFNTYKDGCFCEKGDVFNGKIASVFEWAREYSK